MDKAKLISELTQMDERDRTKKGFNPYALGMYFQAADSVFELIADGATPEHAFSDCFTPTRGMHRVARNLGLKLDVQKGNWTSI